MKAVMLSIQPRWCALIASGKKVIEVRKTKPKLKTPFKCYIYCTKDRKMQFWKSRSYSYADDRSHNAFDKCGSGKVIGEFTCDSIVIDRSFGHDRQLYEAARMTEIEAAAYCLNGEMYGWHISKLVIYDEPKMLCEFKHCGVNYHHNPTINRPPQSWCYAEACDE